VKEPEYVLHRRLHTEVGYVLSRVRFHEAKSILDIALRQLISAPHPSTVLEIGCGYGAGIIYLSYHAPTGIMIGVDVDKTVICQAQVTARYLNVKNLHFIVASASNLPLRDAALDLIICQEVIEHIKDPNSLLVQSERALKNQGKLLVTTPTTNLAPFSSDWIETRVHGRPINDEFAMHLNRFTPRLLLQQVEKAGLKIEQTKFTNQYVGSLLVFILTLWKRKNLRINQNKKSNIIGHISCGYGLPNAVFMAGQTLDYTIFNRFPFGSNIVVLATRKE